ncbi:RNA polymerase sigma factor, partial [Psychromonas aquimarina]|uniref:RNA polymerase sigma factor n=1 Tax=Psychromonas aquimarina TaxID=444919 RepID=UPI000688CFD8
MTDEELMQAYANGDLIAFNALYQRHKSRILGFIIKKLKNQNEAEDVFQQVFTKLHVARNNYRQEIPFLPWIFTITRNTLIDHIRKHQKNQKHINTYTESLQSDTNTESEHTPVSELIEQLSSLSVTQRQALLLRFNQGLTFKEISEQMQMSADNSRQIISRTIRKLRKLMTAK